jgi:hypothetical protein
VGVFGRLARFVSVEVGRADISDCGLSGHRGYLAAARGGAPAAGVWGEVGRGFGEHFSCFVSVFRVVGADRDPCFLIASGVFGAIVSAGFLFLCESA